MYDFGEYMDDQIHHYGDVVDTSKMMSPVRCLLCHHGVYDLAGVEVTARYTDCSMWKTPCCGVTTDDRTWPRASYSKIKKNDY